MTGTEQTLADRVAALERKADDQQKLIKKLMDYLKKQGMK